MKVFVLGTGGWGIALAMLLHQNGHEVTSWTYLQEECDLLHRERCNEKLLPGVVIPEGIEITTDMSGAAKADLVVLAVPSFAVASTAERLAKIVPPHTVIVNVGKGLDCKHGYCRFSETISNADERQQSGRCTDRSDARRGGCTRHSDGYRCGVGEPCGGGADAGGVHERHQLPRVHLVRHYRL